MLTIVIFLLILGLLVFVHELGHFISARILGIGVEEFGFGFPPKIFSLKRKKTIYSINWIPLGGFVRLHGEDGKQKDPESFMVQKAWKRFIVLFSGVFMNIILAVVIFIIGFNIGLPSDLSGDLPAGAKVRNAQIQIVEVSENSAASSIGLNVGDILLKVNNTAINTIQNAQDLAKQAGENIVTVEYSRSGKIYSKPVKLQKIPGTDRAGLGVALAQTGLVSFSFARAVVQGILAAFRSLWMIILAFAQIISDLFTYHKVTADVAGPVGIAILTGQVVKLGFVYLIQFAALLSLNLAIINFLPIPALDGGRALFLLIEKFRGKPISQIIEAKIHNTGFAILLALIVLVTFRDVFKLNVIQQIWNKIF
ncbi:MAG: RIP metalloprotease RseP [Patescibacteria group bacterium]|jgi:regulator of sigma E protease